MGTQPGDIVMDFFAGYGTTAHSMFRLELEKSGRRFILVQLPEKIDPASKEQKEWAEYLIQKVGIWEQRNQKPSEMSGGECQRTAVVRSLINKPELILADEPTGALDEENALALSDLLISLSEEEKLTLVTVTHSSELAGKMDKKYILRNGKLE
jgi:ABC-type lipoprotein export system ATPase subunit